MLNSKLFHEIDEQISFLFTGKLNILLGPNNQILGTIYFLNGNIINVSYRNLFGEKALSKIFIDEFDNEHLLFVVEPENISNIAINFDKSFEDYIQVVPSILERYQQSRKLRPQNDLKLVIDTTFFISQKEVIYEEFKILSYLSDYSRIGDLYDHCDLLDFEITMALVSLRKKSALRVVKTGENHEVAKA